MAIAEKAREFLATVGIQFGRRKRKPITSVADLAEFVTTRAAFVAQKSLYGYLQTRMGLHYPKMFNDTVFSKSLNLAKMNVFSACLSDLTIFAVAEATAAIKVDDQTRNDLAVYCYCYGIEENVAKALIPSWGEAAIEEFADRLRDTDWRYGALRPENFNRSPLALSKWAPVAPELKQYDIEIIENSIKFAWIEVREEFRQLLRALRG